MSVENCYRNYFSINYSLLPECSDLGDSDCWCACKSLSKFISENSIMFEHDKKKAASGHNLCKKEAEIDLWSIRSRMMPPIH